VGAHSLIPHPPQRRNGYGVITVSITAVMLHASHHALTPDPHRLLTLIWFRLSIPRAMKRDETAAGTATLLLLMISEKRRPQPRLMTPHPIAHLHRPRPSVSTMQQHKQSTKLPAPATLIN
jgi:hypothetical protein